MLKLITPTAGHNLTSRHISDSMTKTHLLYSRDAKFLSFNFTDGNEQKNCYKKGGIASLNCLAIFEQNNSANSVPLPKHDFPTRSSTQEIIIKAPLTGKVVSLEESGDVAFSSRFTGHGIAIIPTEGKVSAPIDGEVKVAFLGGHAYIIDHEGLAVMIHIGIDTVNINADWRPGRKLLAFKPKVKTHDHVNVGDELSEVDLNYLKRHKYKLVTPIIAVNESSGAYELKLLVKLNSSVTIGTPIFELIRK